MIRQQPGAPINPVFLLMPTVGLIPVDPIKPNFGNRPVTRLSLMDPTDPLEQRTVCCDAHNLTAGLADISAQIGPEYTIVLAGKPIVRDGRATLIYMAFSDNLIEKVPEAPNSRKYV